MYSYDLLDTMVEESFDQVCELAAALCETGAATGGAEPAMPVTVCCFSP